MSNNAVPITGLTGLSSEKDCQTNSLGAVDIFIDAEEGDTTVRPARGVAVLQLMRPQPVKPGATEKDEELQGGPPANR